jgi:hypothetical protein
MAKSGAPFEGALDTSPVRIASRFLPREDPLAYRENAWINAKEKEPADRNNRKRSSGASSVRLNAQNALKAAQIPTSRESFQGRNRVRLST